MTVQNEQLIDNYNRHLNYLRISITDRCNLRCIYCNPRPSNRKLRHKDILRYEEILRIARISTLLGIKKIRVTGGEPLARKGCCDFLDQLATIGGLEDLSLTTNGVLLTKYIDRIISAGIRRLNISIDTLDREKYHRITGHDVFNQVWEGIELALEQGFSPIKLNIVVLRGINDDEILKLSELSLEHPFHIRFIEHMPIGSKQALKADPLLVPEIMQRIQSIDELIPVKKSEADGPAMRYRFKDAPGEIGFISPVSSHFCRSCNRLRLTADGHILTCLLSDICEDIKTPLRQGLLDEDLVKVFIRAVEKKPHQHSKKLTPLDQPAQMVSIGG